MGAVREAKGGGDTRKVGVEGVGGHPFVERELHLAILHSLHLLFLTISTFLTMQPFRLASCSYSIGFIFAFCFSLCIANLQALTQFFSSGYLCSSTYHSPLCNALFQISRLSLPSLHRAHHSSSLVRDLRLLHFRSVCIS